MNEFHVGDKVVLSGIITGMKGNNRDEVELDVRCCRDYTPGCPGMALSIADVDVHLVGFVPVQPPEPGPGGVVSILKPDGGTVLAERDSIPGIPAGKLRWRLILVGGLSDVYSYDDICGMGHITVVIGG